MEKLFQFGNKKNSSYIFYDGHCYTRRHDTQM